MELLDHLCILQHLHLHQRLYLCLELPKLQIQSLVQLQHRFSREVAVLLLNILADAILSAQQLEAVLHHLDVALDLGLQLLRISF
jgi:hypothetical protein